MSGDKLRIAFVDDHPILLDGIISLFSKRPEFEVVAAGASADDARAIAIKHRPDLIFMDLSMPGNVFAAIREIAKTLSPDTKLIIFTAFSSVDSALRALDAGATGFALKGSTFDELLQAVSTVQRGEVFITAQYAGQVMTGLRNRNSRQSIKLTIRERQVVKHLMQGHTNREIAVTLGLSEKTIKHYMTGLMFKLGARNRLEVVIEAQRLGGLE